MAVSYVRNEKGYVSFHRDILGGTILLTEELLGAIGIAMSHGYLGSSLYLTLNTSENISGGLWSSLKSDLVQAFTCLSDGEELIYDFRDVRSFFDDLGVVYNIPDRVIPLCLLDDYESQSKAFLKGYVLGTLTEKSLADFASTGLYRMEFEYEALYSSMRELLDLLSVPYLEDDELFAITLTSERGNINGWLFDQESGFSDGPKQAILVG